MTNIFILLHVIEHEDSGEDVKIAGVFASKSDAEIAQEKLLSAPGFKEAPSGFSIDRYELGKLYWADGFSTV